MNLINLALFSSGALLAVLIFFIYLRDRGNKINISFTIFLLTVVVWPFTIAFFRMSQNLHDAYLWDKAIYIAGGLTPSTWLIFSYVVTKKKWPPPIFTVTSILVPIFLLYFLLFTNLWIEEIIITQTGKIVRLGPAYIGWLFYYLIFMGAGTIILIKRFLLAKGRDKLQLQFILFSILIPAVISTPFNVWLPFKGNYDWIFIGPFSLTITVLIITYAIVKHRFLDIKLLLTRSVIYILLISTLAIIYSGGLFLASSYFIKEKTSTINLVASTALALIIAVTFQPLRNFFERLTDKIFYKWRYEPDKLIYNLSLKMAENIKLDVLTGQILEILRDKMRISTASFLVVTKKGIEYTVKDHNTFHSRPTNEELELISKENKILIFEELEEGRVKAVLRKHSLSVFTPLITKGKQIGYLLLGEKSSGDTYYEQDIKTLNTLAPQFAVAIQNSQNYEEVMRFNETLKNEVDKATLNLRTANKRLKELGKLKDEFFSIAAHELRTPLTAIQGNTSLMQEYFGDDLKKNKDLQEMVEDVNESSKRLIKIVNDYLDASRLEQGRIVFKKENIDIKEIITNVITETKELTTEKDLYIKQGEEFNTELPQVFADKDRVKQVVYNLVGNAIKYTKEGGLTIHAQKENGSLLLKFEDTGIGIDLDGQQLLFQKFQQVGENHLERKTNLGAGIGLYISKLLIEGMGGKIYLEKSEANKGSIFTFTLPIAKVAKTI